MLHDYTYSEGGLAILRAIPRLDRRTIGKMFGPRATFLIQRKLDQGVDIDVLIGVGAEQRETDSTEAQLGHNELVQLLRRERERSSYLDEELAQTTMNTSKLLRRLRQAEQAKIHAEAVADYWRTAGQGGTQSQEPARNVPDTDKLDPKGYFHALGLHPDVLVGLDDEAADELVKRVYRFLSSKYHPDVGGNAGKMTKLNLAFEVLGDAKKRMEYMRR